jgi:hypothetical protein
VALPCLYPREFEIDPVILTLNFVVWLATGAMRKVMVAQDTSYGVNSFDAVVLLGGIWRSCLG